MYIQSLTTLIQTTKKSKLIVKTGNENNATNDKENLIITIRADEKDISYLFSSMSDKIKEVDLTKFNVSKVVKAISTFSMIKFENVKFIGLEKLNFSNLVNAEDMFLYSSGSTINLSNWKLDKIKTIEAMFRGASIDELIMPVMKGNTLINMSYTFSFFEGTMKFSHMKTDNLEYIDGIFANCLLEHIDISHFNLSKIKNMSEFCIYAEELKSVNFGYTYPLDSKVKADFMFSQKTIDDLEIYCSDKMLLILESNNPDIFH